jgi:HSP20 family protein
LKEKKEMAIPTLRRGSSLVPLRRNDNNSNSGFGRIDPWNDFATMDRVFDNFFRTPFYLFDRGGNGNGSQAEPCLELYETDKELIAYIFAPGLDTADLDVTSTSDQLTVKANRKVQMTADERTVSHTPWSSHALSGGSFNLTYTLPVEIDTQKVSATYKDGILKVHLGKNEAARPTQVKVLVS